MNYDVVISFRIPRWLAEHIEAHRTAKESLHQTARRLLLWYMNERNKMEKPKRIDDDKQVIHVTQEEFDKISEASKDAEESKDFLEFGKRVCQILGVESWMITCSTRREYPLIIVEDVDRTALGEMAIHITSSAKNVLKAALENGTQIQPTISREEKE